MGLYKYLLFIFVLNDIVYTNVFFFTNPVRNKRKQSEIKLFRLFRFEERYISSFRSIIQRDSVFYTQPFMQMGNIRVRYESLQLLSSTLFSLHLSAHRRYEVDRIKCPETIKFTIFRSQWLRLFRTWWFLLFLIFCFMIESATWFSLLYFQYETEQETFDDLFPQLGEEFSNLTKSGIATAHYWVRSALITCFFYRDHHYLICRDPIIACVCVPFLAQQGFAS